MNKEKDYAALQQYVSLYEQTSEVLCRHSAPLMNALRDEALSALKTNGLPTRKAEAYKYTDIPQLLSPDYGLNIQRLDMLTDPHKVYQCEVPGLKSQLHYVVNDKLMEKSGEYKRHEERTEGDEGIRVLSLRDEALRNPQLLEHYYGKLAKVQDDSLTALNTLLAQDGLLIIVPKGIETAKPVQVINLLCGKVPMMVCRRVLIIVEEGAKANLIFCDHNATDSPFLTSQVVECFVERNASLDLYCMEETHAANNRIANLYISQAEGSHVSHHAITLTGGTTRDTTMVQLQGEGASCILNGCIIADRKQHIDNNTLISHLAPHCQSEELYKYVLDEQATGAFAGRILVAPEAQHTDAHMTNQNLLTTREAHMFSQPELVIHADDVKCAHGSTTGQLNDAALFYMRQRGIPLKEARLLLEQAFINEVVEHVALLPLRERLRFLVEKRFRGELDTCKSCRRCR